MSERPSSSQQQQRGKPAGLSLSVPKEDSGEYRWYARVFLFFLLSLLLRSLFFVIVLCVLLFLSLAHLLRDILFFSKRSKCAVLTFTFSLSLFVCVSNDDDDL